VPDNDVVQISKKHLSALLAHCNNPMHPVVDHNGSYGEEKWLVCRMCNVRSKPVPNGAGRPYNEIFHKKDCSLAAVLQAVGRYVYVEE
jgi:hypothetical protein